VFLSFTHKIPKMSSTLTKAVKVFGVGGRCFSSSCPSPKQVTVLGAGGGIGQPLSLLLRMNPLVSQLHLYDMANALGVATDLQHCGGSSAAVTGFPAEKLKQSLKGSDLVVIPAGVPPTVGMSSDDIFAANASIVANLAGAVAENCPNALVAVISNPINSMVPVVAEVMKQWNVYNPQKVFGVTTLNLERANYMIGNKAGVSPHLVSCPVIGGHAEESIIPLFSRCEAAKHLNSVERQEITQKIRDGNEEVRMAKKGVAGPTLSMAYSAGRFCNSLLSALSGQVNVTECTYVRTDITEEDEKRIFNATETKYFVTPVVLGKEGVDKNLGLGNLNEYEQSLLPAAIRQIKFDIQRGEDYVANAGKAGLIDNKLKEEMERRN